MSGKHVTRRTGESGNPVQQPDETPSAAVTAGDVGENGDCMPPGQATARVLEELDLPRMELGLAPVVGPHVESPG